MTTVSKHALLLFLVALILCTLPSGSQEPHSVVPQHGFVPNEETAIAIAVAVWNPIYGKEQIEKQKPYVAELDNDKWRVVGTLHSSSGLPVIGGVAIAEISKKDGRILRVSHGA